MRTVWMGAIVMSWAVGGCALERAGSNETSTEAATQPTLTTQPSTSSDAPPDAPTACARRNGEVTLSRRGVRQSSGALVLAKWDERPVAVVADADEDALHVVDTKDMSLVSTTDLPGSPAHLAIMDDGRVAVSLRHENRVAMYEPRKAPEAGFTSLCSEVVAREPLAMAARGDELLVVSGFGAELVRLDAASLSVSDRIPLAREPRGLLLSQDGEQAFVSHMVGGVLSRVDLTTAEVAPVVTHRRETTEEEPSRGVQGFDLAAHVDSDGFERLLMPQVNSATPDFELIALNAYYGITNRTFTPWVATVDPQSGKMLGVGTETEVAWRSLCMLPRAAIARGHRLWVACLDKGTVVEMDARFLDPMTAVYRQYELAAGPSALAMTEDGALYVWSLFGHELTQLNPPALDDRPTADVIVPPGTRLPIPRRVDTEWTAKRRLGRELFTARDNERLSQNGSSCESCHPDGRDDGLVWATGNTTLFLAGRLVGTAPFGWHGKTNTLEDRVQSTLGRLRGKGLHRERDRPAIEALLAYLETMPGPPPPLPRDAATLESIRRGQHVFETEMMCAACHPGGSTNGSESRIDGKRFDNPSLAYVGATGPYFHDNRYKSLEALLSDPKQPMDQTGKLTDAQRADLANYLRSLPFGAEESPQANAPTRPAQWESAVAAQPVPSPLAHPGRYLERAPTAVPLDDHPVHDMPKEGETIPGMDWLGLRGRDGVLRGGAHSRILAAPTNDKPTGTIVRRYVLSAHQSAALEVMPCTVTAVVPGYYSNTFDVGVMCPDRGIRFDTFGLGGYGYGVQLRVGGERKLFAMGPDTFRRYAGGAIEDIGKRGREWVDLHALKIARGSHAQLVRLTDTDHRWARADFSERAVRSIVNVSWSEAASEPSLLLATLTSEPLRAHGYKRPNPTR